MGQKPADGLCKIQCLGFALNNIGGGAGRASKRVNRGEKTSHESIIFEVGQWFTRVHGKFMILFCFYIYLNFECKKWLCSNNIKMKINIKLNIFFLYFQ